MQAPAPYVLAVLCLDADPVVPVSVVVMLATAAATSAAAAAVVVVRAQGGMVRVQGGWFESRVGSSSSGWVVQVQGGWFKVRVGGAT